MGISGKIEVECLTKYDDNGIRLLFERYYIPLVLFAKMYVRDQEIAKDTVQDVFFTLIQDRQRFESIDDFKTYLYCSVKNRCLKYYRHEEVKGRYQQYVLDNEPNYQEMILENEVYALLEQAIQELPVQCRKVFFLMLEGQNNAEIAAALGIGIETVKSHKKAGKKILYAKLKGTFLIYSPLGLSFLFFR